MFLLKYGLTQKTAMKKILLSVEQLALIYTALLAQLSSDSEHFWLFLRAWGCPGVMRPCLQGWSKRAKLLLLVLKLNSAPGVMNLPDVC